ncbi:outer membrane lipoprotein LolB [Lysobacter pythonis]|uniref:Outer-membrane lipoprotein LolB n=1 Tax=Solilutibacter pythonis TaxID=2483112 RepID=A0A3M2HII8_9GAMM|nr:lipoprotein insertase outer membrane protein LolB [Lysobacter pythonis]RMH89541.1 outer membrane lipoprotein LolB [Lysobacter pythonis]
MRIEMQNGRGLGASSQAAKTVATAILPATGRSQWVWRCGAFAIVLVLLAGCAGRNVKPATGGVIVCDENASTIPDNCPNYVVDWFVSMADRPATAGDGRAWSMSGRVAVASGRQSGNARIEWRQRENADYSVTLSAPVTRQSWRLDVNPQGAAISGLPQGPKNGPDAAALLREATGWDIPIVYMGAWLRGESASGADRPRRYVFSEPGGYLLGFDQHGWRIEFVRAGNQELPTRITATRGESRVRLVIDQWSDGAGE